MVIKDMRTLASLVDIYGILLLDFENISKSFDRLVLFLLYYIGIR
jgi:hypothetical protein